ncbi:MAG TPA: AAA family ATPase [Bacteroidales bacterium]|nr:AAA family ATPase [Bacteroidales bacterium]HOR82320.1 AAA family ATPase [Bacteroidales bacterium]HPJ91594.1 AAA family ATPase [Bacteroidales bacterium]
MSYITKVNIFNYKCFKGLFSLDFNDGVNIIVGNNEAGKSTILEAIHLALTGLLNGRYLRNELSQYLFNNIVTQEYLQRVNEGSDATPPYILLEVFFKGSDFPKLEGNGNSNRVKAQGVSFKILFDDNYREEYEELVKNELKTIPIEYYKIEWKSFARETITARSIPIKSVLIDSAANRYQNGSDIYISKIIKDNLNDKQKAEISQAYRKVKDVFMDEEAIKNINNQLIKNSDISDKKVMVSVDLSTKDAWETSLMTYLDEVPFHQIGKGEQCIIKTNLALAHKKSKEANLILIEEPENHLSHTKLNEFVHNIVNKCSDKQVIITTHNSFVANKLGLENLTLLHNQKQTKFSELDPETFDFFKKLPGYETLRLILCEKAILVEGDCDELIVQKAYMEAHNGRLPIEDGIDVISVGLTFERFLKIAEKIGKQVAVVTDNDGDVESLNEKYAPYVGDSKSIKAFYDTVVDTGDLTIGKDKKKFNYNTLEPKLLKVNSLDSFNKIFGTKHTKIDDMHKYMKNNKTNCALKIFESTIKIKYPEYITSAINWCDEE